MADNLLIIYTGIKKLRKKIKEIKNLPKECDNLCDILEKVESIINSLKDSLFEKQHIELFDSFQKVLNEAETIVDCIIEHPFSTSILSGKYKSKINNVLEKINSWLIKIQSMADAKTLLLINQLIENIQNNTSIIQEELKNIDNQMDNIKDDIKSMPLKTIHLLKNELNILFDKSNKSSKYLHFLDEEDENLLKMIQNQEAKLTHALDIFYCPITKDIMSEPVLCIPSGKTYEKKALYKYFSLCIEKGEYPCDPFTKEKIDDIMKDVISNDSLKETIKNWSILNNSNEEISENLNNDENKDVVIQNLQNKINILENEIKSFENICIGIKTQRLTHREKNGKTIKTEMNSILLNFNVKCTFLDLRTQNINDEKIYIQERIEFIPYSLIQFRNINKIYIEASNLSHLNQNIKYLINLEILEVYNYCKNNGIFLVFDHYIGIESENKRLYMPLSLKILKLYYDKYIELNSWCQLFTIFPNCNNYEYSNTQLENIELHNVSGNLKKFNSNMNHMQPKSEQEREWQQGKIKFLSSKVKFFED